VAEPWLSIIGLGEDGPEGLSPASRAALDAAEFVFGAARHLRLAGAGARGREWSVPFSIAPVLDARGRRVAVLASGDPFWHGAGSLLAEALNPGEWIAFPAPSSLSLAAARLGWRLEETVCIGLHARPFESLATVLQDGAQVLCTLRDGQAAPELAGWLQAQGWGASRLTFLERLGGAHERVRSLVATEDLPADVVAPVIAAIEARGQAGLPRATGLPDDLFAHDGQITKRAVRALTLSALAPRRGEMLWDLGAGSGSVSVEWCLAGGHAVAVESRADRSGNVAANAARFGIRDRIGIVTAEWTSALGDLPLPHAVFVGGGLEAGSADLLWRGLPEGCRLVVNAVTLATQALLASLQAAHGGSLVRIDIAAAEPVGRMQAWSAARTIVQWSVTR
jgi:precorrin-6Y C5,15-methyltransferase (decarboxylating)